MIGRIRYLCLSMAALFSAAIFAQDGEAIFTARCAACHLKPDPAVNAHAPSRDDMAQFTPNVVYAALNDGLMR
ncbi:MAG TPA: hypothetical protein VMH83_14595, partial [Candidatus Acidoferrum sp.]|nr:hypothetical protein [Candidatus Acidoferrum sp.]